MKKKIMSCMTLSSVVLVFLCFSALAVTIPVPSALHPTIQAGIDAALPGDLVEVQPGTYIGLGNRDIDFRGKAITVQSVGGAATAIIDCQGMGRGFWFHTMETAASVLSGFTIMNGSDMLQVGGGGILCEIFSSPTIKDCVITTNMSLQEGGGVFCMISSPRFENCTITGNTAPKSGGVSLDTSSAVFLNCTISANIATTKSGGGAEVKNGNPQFINCVITSNRAPDLRKGIGGGISLESGNATFLNCTFSGNTAGFSGGAIDADTSLVTLTNCILWADLPTEINQLMSFVNATHCNIQALAGTLFPGLGNINANPMFAGLPTDFVNGFLLTALSPCVDTGDNLAPGMPATDRNGLPRIKDGNNPPDGIDTVDMGAFEL